MPHPTQKVNEDVGRIRTVNFQRINYECPDKSVKPCSEHTIPTLVIWKMCYKEKLCRNKASSEKADATPQVFL